MARDPLGLAGQAAAALATRTGVDRHDVLVVLGTGWGPTADALPGGPEVEMGDLPGFPTPTTAGHGTRLRSVELEGCRLLVALGRVHLYEGHPPDAVVHPVRVGAAAGCRAAVLTNASGSLHADWAVGRPVLVSDQINFTGLSPLTGGAIRDRFVPMTGAYATRLRRLAHDVDPTLREGVYMGFHGPEFESPAEVRAARALGADLVGMSTVLEVIAARHLGLEVLGLSLVTNLAAGVGVGSELDVDQVLAVARAGAAAAGDLLRRVLEQIARAS